VLEAAVWCAQPRTVGTVCMDGLGTGIGNEAVMIVLYLTDVSMSLACIEATPRGPLGTRA